MDDKDLKKAGEKVVSGLRDNLLRPMHDSIIKQMSNQHETTIKAIKEDLPKRLLENVAEALQNVRWDNNEPK